MYLLNADVIEMVKWKLHSIFTEQIAVEKHIVLKQLNKTMIW